MVVSLPVRQHARLAASLASMHSLAISAMMSLAPRIAASMSATPGGLTNLWMNPRE